MSANPATILNLPTVLKESRNEMQDMFVCFLIIFLISPKFCKLLLMTGLFKLHIPTNRDLEPPLQLPRPGASSTTAETWIRASSTTAGPHNAVGRAPDSSEVLVSIPVWPHTFVSPSADSREAVVSYWRKYVH